MDRRGLIRVVGAALAVRGLPAFAQPAGTHRVGFLSSGSKADTADIFASLREGLRELGYREGQNLALDARWADYSPERTAALAAEIAASQPALIVAQGAALRPVSRLSPPVRTVFLQSGDPVIAGFADSFARPGRNATGISLLAVDLIRKRMETLKEILPKVRRVAFLANPEHPGENRELTASRAAADELRVQVSYHQARTPAELTAACATLAAEKPDAAVLFSDALMVGQRRVLADFFLKHRIPSAAGWAVFADAGHLVCYGPNVRAAWRRVAYFVDRVLKGGDPSQMPIELPSVVEMVVNRRTAAAMGLVVPTTLLVRADRVIG